MAISQEQIELLKQGREELRYLENLIDQILDKNISQAEAARQLGLRPMQFDHDIKNNLRPLVRGIPCFKKHEIANILRNIKDPYEQLIYDILDIQPDSEKIYIISDELRLRTDHIIQTRLSERDNRVIKNLYGIPNQKPMTLREAGDFEHVSGTLIGIIRDRAIKKLQSRDSLIYLFEGKETPIINLDQIKEFTEKRQEIKQKMARIQASLQNAKSEYAETLSNYKKIEGIFKETQREINKLQIPIEKLNLSTRSCKALYGAKIRYLYQIAKLTEKDIMKIPNLGKKCLTEIKTVLSKYNLSLKSEK